MQGQLSIRRTGNARHHLTKNGRLFWINYTLHTPDYKKLRVMQSLGTADLKIAQHRRDQILWKMKQDGIAESLKCEIQLAA